MAKKYFNKERIIYNTIYDVEDYRDAFKEFCKINDVDENERNIYDYISESITDWFHDENANLNVSIEGDILAIADLGLWDGRYSAYQVIPASKLNDIFRVGGKYDDVKFYCDQYNVKADLYHHDGCNHIEFRLVKKGKDIQPLLDKIYNQESVPRETIRKYTTSLRKYVAEVYGL